MDNKITVLGNPTLEDVQAIMIGVRNKTDKEVSFRDAIIIFTTNAGKQLYETAESGDFSGLPRKVILKALRNPSCCKGDLSGHESLTSSLRFMVK